MSLPKRTSIRSIPPGPLQGVLTDIKRSIEALSIDSDTKARLLANLAQRTSDLGEAIEGIEPGGDGGPAPSNPTPPAPTSVTVTPLYSYIMVAFTGFGYPGHAYAEILRGSTDVLADAVVVGQSRFGPYIDTVGVGSPKYFYWVRFVNTNQPPLTGAANAQNGTEAQTPVDGERLVSQLTGPGLPFKVIEEETTLPDGSVVPPGFYASDGYMHNGFIVNAMIANLAVDDAKIASITADKITAGSIAVGEHIQSANFTPGASGWRINGNGVAEFQEAVVRGTLYASAGQIGGSTIGSTYVRSATYALNESGWNFNADGTGQIGGFAVLGDAIQSTNYVAATSGWRLTAAGNLEANAGDFRGTIRASAFMTGAYTGYAWPPAGAGNIGCYLGPSGLLIGNGNNGRYLQVTAEGNIYAPGFSVVNGVMSITQANVVTSLTIANNAVSVSSSASGNYGATASVWIPSGVSATVVAVAVKRAGGNYYNSNLQPAMSVSLTLAGSTVYDVSNAVFVRNDDNPSNNYSYHASVAMVHQVGVSGGQTIYATASASWINGATNMVDVVMFARWK